MKYMLTLFGEASDIDESTLSEQDMMEFMQPFIDFTAWCEENSVNIVAGEGLAPSMTAMTFRQTESGLVSTDGPFLEIKEQLGGFYLIECDNVDLAMEAAKHCPNIGAVELRPVMSYE